MKVLLLASRDDPARGGSLRVARSLASGLRDLGADVRLVFVYGVTASGGAQTAARALGIERSRQVTRWMRLRDLIRQERPDVVHFVDNVLWAPIVLSGLPAPVLLHVHGRPREPGFSSRPMSLADRLGWRLWRLAGAQFLCITEGVRESVVRLGLVPSERAHALYNAIDVAHFERRPEGAASRDALGLPRDALVLGTVCRVVDGRGLDDMVRVLAHLPPRWRALIVGDGPARAKTLALARTLGVADRLHMPGQLEDVRPAYAAMDAYGFFARYDSFGLATAEAMASGVPVFGLKGLGEYADPPLPLVTPDVALMVPRADASDQYAAEPARTIDELAVVLEAHARDPSDGASRAKRARDHVRTHFDLPRQARDAMRIYERALERR